jgi:hypothetical protein
MEGLVIREVVTGRDRRQFINFPERVHRNDKNWLPPIYMDERELFDPEKNKSYKYADTVLYLACRGKKTVGRIMGIISRRYNELHNEQHGRFCFMECFDDQEVFHALIARVEEWAKAKGMTKLIGPLAFSDKDPQGFQIEGFEYPKFIVCPTNDPYMPEMIEKEGFRKYRDLVNYIAEVQPDIPEVYKNILARLSNNNGYRIVEFKSRKELRPYLMPVLDLLNETFSEIYGFLPLNEDEKKEFINRYMMIIDPRFIKVIENESGVLGFAAGMRDISEGIRKAGGRIFPFGFISILSEYRRSKKLLMLLGGVKKEYRGRGLDVLMGIKMLQSCIEHKMKWIDLHLVLEDNYKMRGECERIGGEVIKRFRIYHKDLQ